MTDSLITLGLLLLGLALGLGISEYYHRRIDRARHDVRHPEQPEIPLGVNAPQPRAVINATDYRRMQQGGRITKMVQGGGR